MALAASKTCPPIPSANSRDSPTAGSPAKGIAPLRRIVEVLKKKGYAGPASLEMFQAALRAMDPYQMAMKVRSAIEPLIA